MGRFSEVVFGHRELPERCLIYAGAYLPIRKDWVRNLFDSWQRVQGQWIKFTFACKNGINYLIVFNVYGATLVLEIIQLLKDGNASKVFFIGSLGGRELPIGTLVLPSSIVDKTGFVAIDEVGKQIVKPDEHNLRRLRRALDDSGEVYVEGEIVSVPSVLHNIEPLNSFVKQEKDILGVEGETSTILSLHSKRKARELRASLHKRQQKTRHNQQRQRLMDGKKNGSKKNHQPCHENHDRIAKN